MTWDPRQYERFRRERYEPFEDLVRLIVVRPGLRVVDLGCGTGELTQRLAATLPGCAVLGIDSSPEMLAQAASRARPGIQFKEGKVEEFAGLSTVEREYPNSVAVEEVVPAQGHRDFEDSTSPQLRSGQALDADGSFPRKIEGEWDIIFSNAVFQWIGGHEKLIPRLFGMLRPGGQLLVQMPAHPGNPAPALVNQIATEEPFRSYLKGWNRAWPQLPIERYAELLYECGAQGITAFEKVYPHVLADADAAFEWSKGTALVPFLGRMSEGEGAEFEGEFRRRLWERWPQGPIFFGYRRVLFAGKRATSSPAGS